MLVGFQAEDDVPLVNSGSRPLETQNLLRYALDNPNIADELAKNSQAGKRNMPFALREVMRLGTSTLFRRSSSGNELVQANWLSRVRLAHQRILSTRVIPRFVGIDRALLRDLRTFTLDSQRILSLPDILAESGIILVYEKPIPRMKLDGVLFKAESGNPVIGISFRHSRVDAFWFTLMHELAHIVLHIDRLGTDEMDMVDVDDAGEVDLIEQEANLLAADSLIDRSLWRTRPRYDRDAAELIRFAEKAGIHPAIVAGRLRREKQNFKIYSQLVNHEDIRAIAFSE